MFSIGSASKFFSFYKALPSYHQTHSQEHKLYPNALENKRTEIK